MSLRIVILSPICFLHFSIVLDLSDLVILYTYNVNGWKSYEGISQVWRECSVLKLNHENKITKIDCDNLFSFFDINMENTFCNKIAIDVIFMWQGSQTKLTSKQTNSYTR